MQIFFPNLATYVIIILITNFIFLYNIIKKTSTLSKITNTIFFTIIMILMFYTLEQIITNNINIYSFEEVYSNDDISVLIQSTTIIFTIWTILIISKLIINKLIQKSIETITNEENDIIENPNTNQINTANPINQNTTNDNNSPNSVNQNTTNNDDSDDDDNIEILTL